MYKMPINNFWSQIYFVLIVQIAILFSARLSIYFEIKRLAPGLVVTKLNTFTESSMMDFQSWLKIKPRLHFFKPVLVWSINVKFQMVWRAFYPIAVGVTVLLIAITGSLVLRLFAIRHQSLWRWMFFLVGAAVIFLIWRFIEFCIIFAFSAAITTIELWVVIFLSTPWLALFCNFILVAIAKFGIFWASLTIAIDPAYVVGAGLGHYIGTIGLITWHLWVLKFF